MNRILHWLTRRLAVKIGAGLVLMSILMAGAIVSVLLFTQAQKSDSTVVNVASGQRMYALQEAQFD